MKKHSAIDLQSTSYTPDIFIELLIKTMVLKNDAALSRRLEVAPPVISKIRHSQLPIGASLLLRAHEESNLPIAELKAAAGLPWKGVIAQPAQKNSQVEITIKPTQEQIAQAFAIPKRLLDQQSITGAA